MARSTLKRQILLITTTVMAAVALFVGVFVGITYQKYSLQSHSDSTQFNLQLISALTESDIHNIAEARRRVRQNAAVNAWLQEPDDSMAMLNAFTELTNIHAQNRSSEDIYRMLVVDRNMTNLIQVGSKTMESRVVNIYNIGRLFSTDDADRPFCALMNDPFLSKDAKQVLPVLQPLYGFGTGTGEILGYLLIEVSSSLLTGHLSGYHTDSESLLYLGLGDQLYRLEDGGFVPDASVSWNMPQNPGDVLLKRLKKKLMITAKVDASGITLSQTIPISSRDETIPLLLITLMVIAILLGFAFLLTWLLNKEVREPVSAIQKKMKAIASGDFSRDVDIEYESELGDIGRGINELSAQVDDLIKRQLEYAQEKQQLEYRILQAQINPHFLNNTLNSIRWMATIQHATGIAEMTTALARLLQHISKSSEEWCTIKEELLLLDDYFVIQNYRYGGTITLLKDVPENFQSIHIPRFTFQPIVENAIFHGLEPKATGGIITIRAKILKEGAVCFVIADDGIGMSPEQVGALLEKRSGDNDGMFKSIGMYNVNQRIIHMYGKGYGMNVESTPGLGTRVSIILPMPKDGTNVV